MEPEARPPVVCTEDPGKTGERDRDFRALLAKSRRVERPTPQHLRLTLEAEDGLDIGVLAREMRCCSWFDFRLAPTDRGSVVLDVRVPSDAGPVRGPVAEPEGIGTPEDLLDTFARQAGGAHRDEADARHDRGRAEHGCGCC